MVNYLGCLFLLFSWTVRLSAAYGQRSCDHAASLSPSPSTWASIAPERNFARTCSEIARALSPRSHVYTPGSPEYQNLTSRYTSSAALDSACVVEPATPRDVGRILRIVGRTRTPFAVQSGGHSSNVGFSSTRGVHISLNALRSIRYDAQSGTVEFGTGLKYESVYSALEPHGVNVLGSRIFGIGTGGFTLGGGYSYMTNQYGLALDRISAFELVKPDGEVVRVTHGSDPELFWGLKGGHNNFGVVTKITLRTFPQGQVWGGTVVYTDPSTFPAVLNAIADFSAGVTDPKASILGSMTTTRNMSALAVVVLYDGSAPPTGIFDTVMNIPSVMNDVTTRSWMSFISSFSSASGAGLRRTATTVATPTYSRAFMHHVYNVSQIFASELSSRSFHSFLIMPEPFLPNILSHNTTPSAYPFTRERVYTPFAINLQWTEARDDTVFHDAARRIAENFEDALIAEGHTDVRSAPLYSNYAQADTSMCRIYGSSLPRLGRLARCVDSENVMGLAGGFKVQGRRG